MQPMMGILNVTKITDSLDNAHSIDLKMGNDTRKRGTELLGYLENWVDVKWWDNNMPGNCYQGCFEPATFIEKTKPYSALNYGFSFLTQDPDPDQLDCSGSHGGKKDPGCPVWDGNAIYLSKASKPFSKAVEASSTIDKPTPSMVAIGEVVRLGR
jgi:hypothetical protein